MFDIFGKQKEPDKTKIYNEEYAKIKDLYGKSPVSAERKKELGDLIEKYGYVPYSQMKAIQELTPEETLYCLEKKWEKNSSFKDGKLIVEKNNTSAVKKAGYTDASWIQKEQHDIKIINLSGLSDGFENSGPAEFIDWLRQIVILPAGNAEKGVMSTTIYLIPFHPRDFGNAYLTASTEEVSEKTTDDKLKEIGINAKEQIRLFVAMSQLAGHPVIYDVFPQTGRFSKTVLAHPEIARWIDTEFLISELSKALDFAAIKLSSESDEDDVTIVKNIYKSALKNGYEGNLTEEYKPIYDRFTQELEEKRKELSNFVTKKSEQVKLQKRVKEIVAEIEGKKSSKINCDKDITKRGEIIKALINKGLWTLPDGAWCSSGIPVFQNMFECESYPVFCHYNSKGEDVTEFAESDCQTPFYFVYLENGEYNLPVINFYTEYLKTLQKDYNFDGFRISHTDFVVDIMSEKDLRPISYRAPRFLLKKVNETIKREVPYFASMAEYRLSGGFYKEYHNDMNFDLLWGNDTKISYEKKPSDIINDNRELREYNIGALRLPGVSVLKTYNNQDGLFRTVNRALSLAQKDETLFKWFKLKFLPGGKYAQRPSIYVDGDENFSKDGIEATIEDDVSLLRNDDEDFYERFDAIRRFAINCELTVNGEAEIMIQHKSGFIAWMISKETVKESLIIAANYLSAQERILTKSSEGVPEYFVRENGPVENRKIEIPGDYVLVSEYVYEPDKKDFVEHFKGQNVKTLEIDKLKPSEFRIFKIKR